MPLKDLLLLDEWVIAQFGSLLRVRRWYAGHHPNIGGKCIRGDTGPETVVEVDVIRAVGKYWVKEPED